MNHSLKLTCAAIPLFLSLSANANVLELKASQDTTINERAPNNISGSNPSLRINQAPGTERSIIKFDLTEIAGLINSVDVISATLEVNVTRFDPDNKDFVDAHAMQMDWDENQASWNCAQTSNMACISSWNGGIFAARESDSVKFDKAAAGIIQFDVTDDVLESLNNGQHFGWLIKKNKEDRGGFIQFSAKESDNSPRLVINSRVDVDLHPPTIRIESPTSTVIVDSTPPLFDIAYFDDFSGIAIDSIMISLDGISINQSYCEIGLGGAQCTVDSLSAGSHQLSVQVMDNSGKSSTETFSFNYREETGDRDDDPTNELQVLVRDGVYAIIVNADGTEMSRISLLDGDSNPANEANRSFTFDPETGQLTITDVGGSKTVNLSGASGLTNLKQVNCTWLSWGSKGQVGPAICPVGQYVAGHEGTGITTGDKRNFGRIYCCKTN